MFTDTKAFSGFSVNDLEAAKQFYNQTLGINVTSEAMGMQLELQSGARVFVYEKSDHSPASFTILNFPVENIDTAVDELVSKGVTFEKYNMPDMPQDEKGILRGIAANMGPDIAWFKDPAGNVLAVLQDS